MIERVEARRLGLLENAPIENFELGNADFKLPEEKFGKPKRGKTAITWEYEDELIIYHTDINSAHDTPVCSIPRSGDVKNLTSAWMFRHGPLKYLPNHFIDALTDKVTVAEKLDIHDVEYVWRSRMSDSSTKTSLSYRYFVLGERNINGVILPDGLKVNEIIPGGPVFDPASKAKEGHDEILSENKAREIVDAKHGTGSFDRGKGLTREAFVGGRKLLLGLGLDTFDSKFEVGVKNGVEKIADEVFTPHSSRIVLTDDSGEIVMQGKYPESLDKENLRRLLYEMGYRGEGPIPHIHPLRLREIGDRYERYHNIITGELLGRYIGAEETVQKIVDYFKRN